MLRGNPVVRRNVLDVTNLDVPFIRSQGSFDDLYDITLETAEYVSPWKISRWSTIPILIRMLSVPKCLHTAG